MSPEFHDDGRCLKQRRPCPPAERLRTRLNDLPGPHCDALSVMNGRSRELKACILAAVFAFISAGAPPDGNCGPQRPFWDAGSCAFRDSVTVPFSKSEIRRIIGGTAGSANTRDLRATPAAHSETEDVVPSFNLGGRAAYGSAPGQQIYGSIETNGTGYLVAWEDLRDGSWDLYGARLETDGSLLDSSGIAISVGPCDEGGPAIASDGTSYFVVWQDSRNGSDDIYGARLDPDGRVLDPSGIPLVTSDLDLRAPDVAFDGTNYLVVWQDSSSGSYDVYGVRVNTEGCLIDSMRLALSASPCDQGRAAVGFDGTNYLVVWQDRRNGSGDIYGARVGTAGCVLDSAGIPISVAEGDQKHPDLVFGSGCYLIVWLDARVSLDFDEIYGARVDGAGVVLDPKGIPISTGYYEPWQPKASFDGVNFVVVWDDWRDPVGVKAARVTTGGSVLDSGGVPVEAAMGGWAPEVVFRGGAYSLIWHHGVCKTYDTFVIRLTGELTPLDSVATDISMATRDQRAPAVSYDGSNYFVVWEEYCCAGADLYGTRVAPDATVLDPYGIPLSTASGNQTQPAVAFDGTNYLVVWQDSRDGPYEYCDIYGTRITPDGTVLDPSGIPISITLMSQEQPDLAFDGANYLVVWQREVLGSIADIYGARLNTDGEVLDPEGIPISAASATQEYPAVEFDGANYMVVWQDMRNGVRYDIYGARVAGDGTVVDPAGILISNAEWSQKQPDLAFDGTNYLVAWHDKRSGSGPDIYAARLTIDGDVLDPLGIPVSMDPGEETGVAVAFTGTHFLVGWKASGEGYFDTYAARISTYGSVLDPGGFPVSSADLNQLSPAISVAPSGRTLIAYSSFTPGDYNSYRIWGGFLGDCGGLPDHNGRSWTAGLYQNWPNPFVGLTAVRFALPDRCYVSVRIYDVTGRLVYTLLSGMSEPGLHNIRWDGRSTDRIRVAPGVYLCRMETGAYVGSIKMVITQ
jgi:hypothetical protein